MKNFFSSMLDCKEEIYSSRNRKAADAYIKLDAFVRSGKYSTSKHSKALSTMMLDGLSNYKSAARLGISENTVRVIKQNLSNSLYSLFGNDFFDLLLSDPGGWRVLGKMYVIENYDVTSFKYISDDMRRSVAKSLDEDSDYDFSFDDCAVEFDFLCRYSIPFMLKELEGLDPKKLMYLIDCIDGKSGGIDERARVLMELDRYIG